MRDLLRSERQGRQKAEEEAAAMRKLLIQVGARLAGDALQEVGRSDPTAIGGWTPRDWQAFFERALGVPLSGSLHHSWGSNGQRKAVSIHSQVDTTLKAEIARLKAELEKVRRRAEDLQKELSAARRELHLLKTNPRPPAEHTGTAHRPTQTLSAQYRGILQRLTHWQPPSPPARFAERVSDTALQWRRQSMALFILAHYGLNARLELDHLIAQAEGLKPRSGSLRRAIEHLVKSNLLESRVLKLNTPPTRLALVKLSEDGKGLCHILDWQVVESEWEKLNRLHQGKRFPEHTMAVLAFAMHARLRGYEAVVLPEVQGRASPDVLIRKGDERHYVEVELGTKERAAKWRNQVELQGHIALCARDPRSRARLVGDCKLANLPGLATDLEMLIGVRLPDITADTPLWAQHWK